MLGAEYAVLGNSVKIREIPGVSPQGATKTRGLFVLPITLQNPQNR